MTIFAKIFCNKFFEMLNRRILRVKTFKMIYALTENPEMSFKEAAKRLERSCDATRDLYLFLLALTEPLTGEAATRIEASRSKFSATEEERNPNLKFLHNRIPAIFAEDPDFQRIVKKKKLTWQPYDAFLRHLYEEVREEEWFLAYMNSGEDNLREDAALWGRIYALLEDNAELDAILEDLSMNWSDELPYVLRVVIKTMQQLGDGKEWNLPPLYKSEMDDRPSSESDRDFILKLLKKAVCGFDGYKERLSEQTQKWKLDRICATDLALIVCGIAEAEAFPGTPRNVIINEYVEISKYYSTPESSAFVNGLLDKLLK